MTYRKMQQSNLQRQNNMKEHNDLILNKKYVMRFSTTNGKILTYTGVIKAVSDEFITFIDKFNKEVGYKKSLLISFEEVQEAIMEHNRTEAVRTTLKTYKLTMVIQRQTLILYTQTSILYMMTQ